MVLINSWREDSSIDLREKLNIVFGKELKVKSLIIASAIALGLAIPGAFAHEDEHHAGKGEKHGEGHAAALGKPGEPGKISRTIDVEMSDAMRFSPADIKVKRGETIKFVVKNTGQLKHELVLGSIEEFLHQGRMLF